MGPPDLVGVAAAMVARVEDRGGSSGYTLRGPIARLAARVARRLFSREGLLPWVVGLNLAFALFLGTPDHGRSRCLARFFRFVVVRIGQSF
jgi:hypothetical protein